MNDKTRTKALAALDGMREIVRREMLITGLYIDDEVSNPRLVAAICGGRKHCAVGSLWVGAGIKHTYHNGMIALPGVGQSKRSDFMRHRPGLKAAYAALNAAATEFAKRRFGDDEPYEIEELFENHYGEDLTKRDLLAVIASAKRKVKATA